MFFTTFFPATSLTRVLKILKMISLKYPLQKKSKTEELNDILCQPRNQHLDHIQENVLTRIKNAMTFYKAAMECLKVLAMIKSHLNSLPPSSVKAERRFSAAGLFVSKLRSSMNDEMIDCLIFACSYLARK